jgi:hypothetical protein
LAVGWAGERWDLAEDLAVTAGRVGATATAVVPVEQWPRCSRCRLGRRGSSPICDMSHCLVQ